mgnify:CR=1 FL=1
MNEEKTNDDPIVLKDTEIIVNILLISNRNIALIIHKSNKVIKFHTIKLMSSLAETDNIKNHLN